MIALVCCIASDEKFSLKFSLKIKASIIFLLFVDDPKIFITLPSGFLLLSPQNVISTATKSLLAAFLI